jgi:hypothetical protein
LVCSFYDQLLGAAVIAQKPLWQLPSHFGISGLLGDLPRQLPSGPPSQALSSLDIKRCLRSV